MAGCFREIIKNNKKILVVAFVIIVGVYAMAVLSDTKTYKKTYHFYNHYSALTALPDPTPLLIYWQYINPNTKINCCPAVATKKLLSFQLTLCKRPTATTKQERKATMQQCMLLGHFTLLGSLISSSLFYSLLIIYVGCPLWVNYFIRVLLIKNCIFFGLFMPIRLRTIIGVMSGKYHAVYDLVTQVFYSMGFSLVVFILPITLLLFIGQRLFIRKKPE